MCTLTACGPAPTPPATPPVTVEATDTRPDAADVPEPPEHASLGSPWQCPVSPDNDVVGHWPQCPVYLPWFGLVGVCPRGAHCPQPCRSIWYDYEEAIGGPVAVSETRYTYDDLGRLASSLRTGAFATDYPVVVPPCTYEPGGCAERKVFEGGHLVSRDMNGTVSRFQWNDHDQLVGVAFDDGNVTPLVYDDAGRLLRIGDSQTMTYDADGNLLGDGAFLSPTATYDAHGRVVKQEGGVTPLVKTFDYDAEGRLIRETRRTSYDGQLVGLTHYFYRCRAE